MTCEAAAFGDDLWRSIRREVEDAIGVDAQFGAALSAAVLDHADFGSVLSRQIGLRLGVRDTDQQRYAGAVAAAFKASPALIEAAQCDLKRIARDDPASPQLLPPLLNFKGYIALQAWRVSNWLWQQNRTDYALLLQSESSNALQVSIHPSASIGTSVFLDHATGIIIGAHVAVGDDVTMLQNVTIGRGGTTGRAPTIGNGVYLGSGATVLGDISIGDLAKIGADAVVTADVPAGRTAVGVPARRAN